MPATPPAAPQGFGSAADPLIGRLINDRFKVTAALGHGGMGRVYKALQSPLDRVVALKVLGAGHDRDPNFYKRFFLEASVTARLTHPNTITLYDYGQSQDGIFFIAMEFVDGRTLAATLQQEGPLSQDRVIHVAQQICRSLREAHGLGIIHRDLKPANVMLLQQHDDHDFVKVLDFGLVKFYQGENPEEDITNAGTFMGSPHYIAPEQARNQNPDQRCDIYSLGVLLHHMLTGRVPFTAANPVDIILKHLHDAPPPIRRVRPELDLHPELEALVLRCLAKDRKDRYQSMDELLAHLKAVRHSVTGGSGPHSMPPPLSQGTASGPMAAVPPTPANGHRTPAYGQRSPAVARPAVKAPPPPPADAFESGGERGDSTPDSASARESGGASDPGEGESLEPAPIDAPILLRTSSGRAAGRRSRTWIAIPALALVGAAGAAALWPHASALPLQRPVFRLDASAGLPTLSASKAGSSAQIKLVVGFGTGRADQASYRPTPLGTRGAPERDSGTCGADEPAYVAARVVLTPLDTGSTLEPRVLVPPCQFCEALTGSPTCSHELLKNPGPMRSLSATVLNTVDPATGSGALPTGHYAIKVIDGSGEAWTIPYQLGAELGGTAGGSQSGFLTVTP